MPALLGFNVGVELGQLLIVAVLWPVLAGLARLRDVRWHRAVLEAGTGAVCGLAVYWWISRAFA